MQSQSATPALLRVADISRRFRQNRALDGLTFTIPEGVDGTYDLYLTVSKIMAQFTSQPFSFRSVSNSARGMTMESHGTLIFPKPGEARSGPMRSTHSRTIRS